MPWKPSSSSSRLELKKRRLLRRVIESVKRTEFTRLSEGSVFKEVTIPAEGRPGYNTVANSEGDVVVSLVHPDSHAHRLGVKKNWVVRSINGKEIVSGYSSSGS